MIKRCVFTDAELQHLPDCHITDEFVAHAPGLPDLGVIVYRDGTVGDRWGDGTVGLDDDVRALAGEVETLNCTASDDCADNWIDVVVDENDQVVRPAIQVGVRLFPNPKEPLESVTEFQSVETCEEAAKLVRNLLLANHNLTLADGLKREIVVPIVPLGQ